MKENEIHYYKTQSGRWQPYSTVRYVSISAYIGRVLSILANVVFYISVAVVVVFVVAIGYNIWTQFYNAMTNIFP